MAVLELPLLLFVGFTRDLVGIGLRVDLASDSSWSELSTIGLFCLLAGGAMSRCQWFIAHDVLLEVKLATDMLWERLAASRAGVSGSSNTLGSEQPDLSTVE